MVSSPAGENIISFLGVLAPGTVSWSHWALRKLPLDGCENGVKRVS